MSDPQNQIRIGSHNEELGGEKVDDSLSRRDEQDAQSKKARTASERAQNFEELLIQELRDRVGFLEGRICLNETLPSEVSRLQQCLDSFRAIGNAQIVVTIAGTLAVGISGLDITTTAKWIWYGVGATCLVVSEMYRWVSQNYALPPKNND